MLTSSAKAKGRRAAQALRAALLEFAPELQPDDIAVTPSGVTGPDLWLSPRAQEIYPPLWEVKNQERIAIWEALAQAATHSAAHDGKIAAVAFTRNRSEMHVALRLQDFLRLLRL